MPIGEYNWKTRTLFFLSTAEIGIAHGASSLCGRCSAATKHRLVWKSTPPEYVPVFHFIERHTLTFDTATGGKLRDLEIEEIYRSLRRRPDGRSLGPAHDFLWQVAATVLALRPLSQAEYEEVFGRLARSCGAFGFGATSRNYFERVGAHWG
jgi:hypothetical protein